MRSKAWLQRNQVVVYAVSVALAAAFGVGLPSAAPLFEASITPVLAVLLYVTFLEIPFVRFREAFTNVRFLGAALGMNFLVVPAVAFALTRVLPAEPAILLGALLVLLTPCVDYVIAFTDLADGDAEQVTAVTPALLLVQFALLPGYLWLFLGDSVAPVISAGPFVEAFLSLIAIPLTLAWLTEALADRATAARRWQAAMGWLPVPAMGATLLVVVASQLPRVADSAGQLLAVVPVYVAFLAVMPVLGRIAAGLFGMDAGEARALVFTSVTRNSLVVLPLALALPAGYELVPAVVVTQTLIELTGMVVLTRAVPAWLVPTAPETAIPGQFRSE
ncbi:arsenic resistance protein [Halobellus rufus]|uniref:arsenic resistance protein n=1 Tax=Halobellus rufus TaxID=1448860 RepID=UPI000679C5A1|nr:bile acid:sodium symporter [Halobellus rufus]